MEIVSIEKKTFEMMMAAFGALSEKVAALRRKSDTGRMERWLTGEEVCGQLRISPRTLDVYKRQVEDTFQTAETAVPLKYGTLFGCRCPVFPVKDRCV